MFGSCIVLQLCCKVPNRQFNTSSKDDHFFASKLTELRDNELDGKTLFLDVSVTVSLEEITI